MNTPKPYHRNKNKLLQISNYVIFCGLIPLMFFVLVEMVLRIADYGYPSDFFVKQIIGEQEYFVNNFKFGWRFFPKPIARLSASVVVPVKKDVDAFRVFVFGESAAMGDPDPSFSFSRMLLAQLEKTHPDKKIEIYNTAMTAINSHVILPIVEDCLKLEPDLFIIYAGNNEVIGPYGLSAALSPFLSHRILIRSKIWFDQTKIGQWLASYSAHDAIDQKQWRGMEMFMKNKVAYNNPDLEKIYTHFQENLTAICQKAARAGVKVVLSTVITNTKDCVPFLSLHNTSVSKSDRSEWQRHFDNGVVAQNEGQYIKAVGHFMNAYLLDNEHAELNFRLGRCYLSSGQNEKAGYAFVRARDMDALRFRADSRMNEIIKHVAYKFPGKHVYLADAHHYATVQSEFGLLGNDLLYEHVHLNLAGNFLLAKCVAQQVENALGFPRAMELVTLEDCKKRLSYTPFDNLRINMENRARIIATPFTLQYTNRSDVKVLDQTIKTLETSWDSVSVSSAYTHYAEAVENSPTDYFLRINRVGFLYHFQYYEEAGKEAEIAFSLLPYEYFSFINMGGTRQGLNRDNEAEQYFQRAIRLNPYFMEGYRSMAKLKEKQQQFFAAAAYVQKGNGSSMDIAMTYNRGGISFAEQKNLDSAIHYFNKAVKQQPGFAEAERNLRQALEFKSNTIVPLVSPAFSNSYNQANALFNAGKFKEAIDKYHQAIQLNPSFGQAYNNIGIAFIQLDKKESALEYLFQAVRIDPGFTDAHINLATLLRTLNRHKEAIGVLKQAINRNSTPELSELMAEIQSDMGGQTSAEIELKEKDSQNELVHQ